MFILESLVAVLYIIGFLYTAKLCWEHFAYWGVLEVLGAAIICICWPLVPLIGMLIGRLEKRKRDKLLGR